MTNTVIVVYHDNHDNLHLTRTTERDAFNIVKEAQANGITTEYIANGDVLLMRDDRTPNATAELQRCYYDAAQMFGRRLQCGQSIMLGKRIRAAEDAL